MCTPAPSLVLLSSAEYLTQAQTQAEYEDQRAKALRVVKTAARRPFKVTAATRPRSLPPLLALGHPDLTLHQRQFFQSCYADDRLGTLPPPYLNKD